MRCLVVRRRPLHRPTSIDATPSTSWPSAVTSPWMPAAGVVTAKRKLRSTGPGRPLKLTLAWARRTTLPAASSSRHCTFRARGRARCEHCGLRQQPIHIVVEFGVVAVAAFKRQQQYVGVRQCLLQPGGQLRQLLRRRVEADVEALHHVLGRCDHRGELGQSLLHLRGLGDLVYRFEDAVEVLADLVERHRVNLVEKLGRRHSEAGKPTTFRRWHHIIRPIHRDLSRRRIGVKFERYILLPRNQAGALQARAQASLEECGHSLGVLCCTRASRHRSRVPAGSRTEQAP